MKKAYTLIVVLIVFPVLFFGVVKIAGNRAGDEVDVVVEVPDEAVEAEVEIKNDTEAEEIISEIAPEEETATAEPKDEPVLEVAPEVSLSAGEIREIIASGIKWMKKAQEENGHFKYEYYPVSGLFSEDDNMVRQTGALYIMGEVLKRDTENKYELKETVKRAISYLKENSIEGNLDDKTFKCILTSSKICSLGATSLALIGIVDLIEVYPEETAEYENLLSDYLGFVLAMKKENGGFRGNFYFDGGQSELESDFSSGEAFLALAKYYGYKPAPEIKKTLDDSFDYFAGKYGENPNANFYLWGMAGIKELNRQDPDAKYYNFVKDYTDWRIRPYRVSRNNSHNLCAYIEGVISAYSVIKPNLEAGGRKYYEEEIMFWLDKTRDLQVGSENFLDAQVGGGEMTMMIINPDIAYGGFLTGLNIDDISLRIDFTQHCLSSYLQKLADIDGISL